MARVIPLNGSHLSAVMFQRTLRYDLAIKGEEIDDIRSGITDEYARDGVPIDTGDCCQPKRTPNRSYVRLSYKKSTLC